MKRNEFEDGKTDDLLLKKCRNVIISKQNMTTGLTTHQRSLNLVPTIINHQNYSNLFLNL